MKALILKDLFNIKKQGKFIFGVVLIYGLIGMFLDVNFLGPFLIILCLILPINTFSFDKYSKWDNYALTLPVTRAQLVISKYLLGLSLAIFAILINSVFYLISYLIPGSQPIQIEAHLIFCYSILFASLICFSILFPFVFKLGIEKSRIVLFVIFLIHSISITLFPELFDLIEDKFGFLVQYSFVFIILVSLVMLISIFTLSICISIGILNKKDF
ncbi:MAG: ABC-2 transporter permease [Anaerovorax sp.]|nr:ABC-2 transporter permease [Anaerovorax sp.]